MVLDVEVFNYKGIFFCPFHVTSLPCTPLVFALELIGKRVSANEEHFTAHRKDSWIKYPINFRPFIVKKTIVLPMVEHVFKAMNFQVAHAHNYDPKGIISQRRV